MIAYCGIDCAVCPAFVATQNDDHQARAETAADWSKMFKAEIKPEDVNCDGCQSRSQRLFKYCAVCAIRKCAQDKALTTCAPCPDYPCSELDNIHKMVPEARQCLEEIRAGRSG